MSMRVLLSETSQVDAPVKKVVRSVLSSAAAVPPDLQSDVSSSMNSMCL